MKNINKNINKNIVIVVTMSLYFIIMLGVCLFRTPQEYSDSERRQLKQFPEVTSEKLLDGTFVSELEDYMLDQFPGRDNLRSLKSYMTYYGFMQMDNNGIYISDGYVSSMEYPMNEHSIEHAVERFETVYDLYLKGKDMQIAYAVIPDKNYFMAESSGHLTIDYKALLEKLEKEIDFMEYINIINVLELEDYYRTDTHWRQEKIIDVAKVIGKHFEIDLAGEYTVNRLKNPFYGVYYGQAALPVSPEDIYYLTNDMLEQCVVYDYENNREMTIYDMEKAYGKDPYEMFLSGSLSLLTIENDNAKTDKELVVFRDSFGSSLVPLLAEGYRKITLVDIRYIPSERVGKFVEFDNQDILFIYSTHVLNNSETIK